MNTYQVSFDLSATISHIGADVAGIGVENVTEWVHSDTLFSAIVHSFAHKFGFDETETLIKQFPPESNEIPFRISSAYLATGDIFFVPKPKIQLPDYYRWTDLFKVKFISLQNLYKWIGIERIDWHDDNVCREFVADIQNDWDIYNKLFTTRVRAVNAKDRLINQTQVFHRGETIYSAGTKLYFFINVSTDYENKIKEAIQFMTDFSGLGGEIKIGFSQMKGMQWQPFSFPNSNGSQRAYLLSLYPIYQETDWENSWYDVINRKSWFNSPYFSTQLKKKAVKMLAEGSCLSSIPSTGKLIDVTPDKWLKKEGKVEGWHRIYRNGIGFWIGF